MNEFGFVSRSPTEWKEREGERERQRERETKKGREETVERG